jgi:outer membrane protein TolC
MNRLSPMPPPVPVGMPQLLERRPDVAAAERRVAAADRVGEATPRSCRASPSRPAAAVSARSFSSGHEQSDLSIGGKLAPIYQGGALRAQSRSGQRNRSRRSPSTPASDSARRRGRECAGCHNALRERDAILRGDQTTNARWSRAIQYRVGVIDLRGVEQSQLSLYVARMSRLRVQTERLAQRVNLYLALGGGFDLPVMAPVTAGDPAPLRTQN